MSPRAYEPPRETVSAPRAVRRKDQGRKGNWVSMEYLVIFIYIYIHTYGKHDIYIELPIFTLSVRTESDELTIKQLR